jgi:hypothetical protein
MGRHSAGTKEKNKKMARQPKTIASKKQRRSTNFNIAYNYEGNATALMIHWGDNHMPPKEIKKIKVTN